MCTRSRMLVALAKLSVVLGAGLLFAAGAGAHTEQFTFEGEELILVNLIGEIRIGRAPGDRFEVEVEVLGDDAGPDVLEFKSREGRDAELLILFPLEEENSYVYPRMGRGSSTNFTFSPEPGSQFTWKDIFGIGKNRKVKVRGSGRGMEVWADVTVLVPEGAMLYVDHGVGSIEAENLAANLRLDINSGPIDIRQLKGSVDVDTGSGSVSTVEVTGKVAVDTGSGSVEVSDCTSKTILVDTGSGSVTASDLICEELDIDTGSGGVRALAVTANDVRIDTGSGSVRLELDRMGDGDIDIDTGSGGIDLKLAQGASARVEASTGSGGIDVDIDGVRIRKHRSDDVSFRIGDGDTFVRLDTGSGGIRIWQ